MINTSDIKVPSSIFHVLEEIAVELNVDYMLEEILAAAGITVAQYRDPEYQYSQDQVLHFLRLLKKFPTDYLPVELIVKNWSLSSFGMLALAGMSSSSIGESVKLIREYSPLYMPAISIDFNIKKQSGRVEVQLNSDWSDMGNMLVEIGMLTVDHMEQEFTGGLPNHTIHFKHANEIGLTDEQASKRYAEFMNCNVVFSSHFTGVEADAAFWDTPHKNPNNLTRDMAVSVLKKQQKEFHAKDSFASRVRNILSKAAEENCFLSLEELAETMHRTPRTLMRRLSKENIQFKSLAAEVRFEKAKDMLASTDMTIKQIAHKTGYKDSNSFTRAFKNLSGISPKQWRQTI